MAEDEKKNDADNDGKQKSGLMKILLMIVLPVVVIGGAIFVTLTMTGGVPSDTAEAAPDAESAKPNTAAAIYLPLDPPFTVTLAADNAHRYLQVTLSVMAHSEAAIDAVRRHRPAVRDNINMLLSSLSYKELSTREGKEKLRQQAIEQISQTLADNGEEETIDAIYFTDLVID